MCTKDKIFQILEHAEQLNLILEKVLVLSDDIVELYINRINLKTQQDLNYAEHELNIASIKAEVLQTYVCNTAKMAENLFDLTEAVYEYIKGNQEIE